MACRVSGGFAPVKPMPMMLETIETWLCRIWFVVLFLCMGFLYYCLAGFFINKSEEIYLGLWLGTTFNLFYIFFGATVHS